MAVIKVFDSKGVKTLQMLGYANDQPYDEVEEPTDEVEEIEEKNPFE